MNRFIIHLTDSVGLDQRISVDVVENDGIGQAAHLAIDDILSHRHRPVAFPLFLDIHRAENFPEVAALYPRSLN